MTTLELKNSIIQKLAQIDDPEFLKAIKTIMDAKQGEKIYFTSVDQKQRIQENLKEYENTTGISNENLVKEINEWLEKK